MMHMFHPDERELIAQIKEQGQERQLWALHIGGVTEYEMVVNGVFIMSTYNWETEMLLVRKGLERIQAQNPAILIGGLGMGFSVKEACLHPKQAASIDVVEIDPVVLEWNRTLIDRNRAYLTDPRVRVVQDDFIDYVQNTKKSYHCICMDIDNGPALLVYEKNSYAYSSSFFAQVRSLLRPGGVFAVWSGNENETLLSDLSLSFPSCLVEEIEQDILGKKVSYYLYFGLT